MRNAIAIVMAFLLVSPVSPAASQPSAAKIKEKVLLISGGSPIEVRLAAKGKLNGRLGPVNDTGFTMDLVKDGKIQTQTVRFEDVKSVKRDNSATPMSAGAKAGWAILIVSIVLGAVVGLACATGNGCGSG